jgi:hypothetical protein
MGHGLMDVLRSGTAEDLIALMVDPDVMGGRLSSVDVGRYSDQWHVRWRIDGADAMGQGPTLADALRDALASRLTLTCAA